MRVLIVDDEPLNRDLFSRYLRKKGFEVMSAKDGMEALDIARDHAFDLVLLDLMMPRLDGAQFLQRWREEQRSACPVVVVTAASDLKIEQSLSAAGAAEVLHKPISGRQLLEVLRKYQP